ncbi:MAG: glycosyltransferase family 2 protein [Thermoproteota archaeon]
MRVSVIIPTYFRKKDLAELLECLLSQTYRPFEVIVVDDTPNDEIECLCKEHEAKFNESGINLIYIRNPRERSAAVARNVGVEKACGEVLLFLDSDMLLFDDFIEKIIDLFEKRPHSLGIQGYIVNTSMRIDRLNFLRDVFNRIFHTYYRYPKDSCKLFEYPSSLSKVIECEWLSGANSAYRREVFNHFRFDENLKGYSFMEDILFSHTLFKKHPGTLFMTPYAKSIHKLSPKDYEVNIELEKHKQECRKYVLRKLFGFKGVLLYHWQNIGLVILNLISNFKRLTSF